MPRTKFGSLPSYRLHKPSGRAVVTIHDIDHYLGRHGSAESRDAYDKVIAEFLSRPAALSPSEDGGNLTVSDLILAYHRHASEYYRDAPAERSKIQLSLRPLRRLYGATAASEFRPLALQAVRQEMLKPQSQTFKRKAASDVTEWTREYQLSRRTINMRIDVIRRMFKWAVSQELIPTSVYEGLRTVAGLKKGRSSARDDRTVRPASDADVDRTLLHVSRHVRGMIEFQRLTGARSGEICRIRAGDLDRGKAVWEYRPAKHKTAHRGHERVLYIGPKAQRVLVPFLDIPSDEFVFSPRRCRDERYRFMRAARKTKVPPSQEDRRKRKPTRSPGD